MCVSYEFFITHQVNHPLKISTTPHLLAFWNMAEPVPWNIWPSPMAPLCTTTPYHDVLAWNLLSLWPMGMAKERDNGGDGHVIYLRWRPTQSTRMLSL